MNVLLVHQFFATPSSNGGTRHYELFDRLKKRDVHLTVIASPEQLKNVSMKKKTDVDSCRIISISSLPLGQKGYVWRVLGFFSFMLSAIIRGLCVRNIDVVIGTSPSLFQAFASYIIASIRRKPFLLEVRDLWPSFAIDIGLLKSPTLIRMAKWLEAFLYRKAKHIVVNSPAYVTYLLEHGVRSEKISLVPNGVDVGAFTSVIDSSKEKYRRDWGVATNQFVVVYAGAIRMANHLDIVVEAASVLRNKKSQVFIAVIGDGRERSRLEAQVAHLGLKNIKFCGPESKSEMPNVIATADACFAGLKDISMFTMTYPNKVFDYMAGGRPTILAIDGVIRDVIEASGGGVFVPPSDAVAIAEAMHDLSLQPRKAQQMGEQARDYVSKNFNRDDQAEILGKVLDGLLVGAYINSKSPVMSDVDDLCRRQAA